MSNDLRSPEHCVACEWPGLICFLGMRAAYHYPSLSILLGDDGGVRRTYAVHHWNFRKITGFVEKQGDGCGTSYAANY